VREPEEIAAAVRPKYLKVVNRRVVSGLGWIKVRDAQPSGGTHPEKELFSGYCKGPTPKKGCWLETSTRARTIEKRKRRGSPGRLLGEKRLPSRLSKGSVKTSGGRYIVKHNSINTSVLAAAWSKVLWGRDRIRNGG